MPRHSLILLSLLAIFSLLDFTSCHSSPSKTALQYMNQNGFGRKYSGQSQEEDYVIPGDSVRVFDVNHPVEVNFTVQVSTDGTVLLDQVGRVNIGGYTRSGLEAYLAERYSPYYTTPPSIVVDITTTGKVFFVLGQVESEGSKPFRGNLTVLDVVIDAVPMQDTANIGRCLLIRGDPQKPLRLPFNLNDIIKGDMTTNYSIHEDDIVWIPPTLFAEFGFFLRAALFPVTAVFQAIGGALLGGGNGRNNNGNNRGLLSFGGVF